MKHLTLVNVQVPLSINCGHRGVHTLAICQISCERTALLVNSSLMSALRTKLRTLGPAITSIPCTEALRAGFGACLGLGMAGLFLLSPIVDPQFGLYLIAPLGATSVLLFAVPNSPLAQPWSAIVGNSISALVGVAVCIAVADPTLRIAMAVGLSIAAMALARAVHPPGGAVAMVAAMSSDTVNDLGFRFALAPVAIGTVFLVCVAMIYARATGRRYPFRQFDESNMHGTADPTPGERLSLSEDELAEILRRYRQSLNLGVEDLARLIGAAELQAASHRIGPITAGDIMSRDLVTVGPETNLAKVADLFTEHGFTSLPVVQEDDRFVGVIYQIHLIRRSREDAKRLQRSLGAAMARLIDPGRDAPVRACEVMAVATPRVVSTTPIAALLPMLSDGEIDAVPVLNGTKIVGIVTRSDLIAALARQALNPTK